MYAFNLFYYNMLFCEKIVKRQKKLSTFYVFCIFVHKNGNTVIKNERGMSALKLKQRGYVFVERGGNAKQEGNGNYEYGIRAMP